MKLPMFNGKFPYSWIYHANNFFTYHRTPCYHKVFTASCYVEGEALIWFQEAKEVGHFTNWGTFVEAFLTRFGSTSYVGSMEGIIKHKPISCVGAILRAQDHEMQQPKDTWKLLERLHSN